MDSIHPSGETSSRPGHVPFLRRVSIRNYKSIETADVSLGALTILVGRNGSGKSNFLDALHFIADALQTSLDHALKLRGGFGEIGRRWLSALPLGFSIEIEAALPGEHVGRYEIFMIPNFAGTRSGASFTLRKERLTVWSPTAVVAHYAVADGDVIESSVGRMPPAFNDRLYLVTASSFQEFRGFYDALSAMEFYHLNPAAMKTFQAPEIRQTLQADGSNLASIVSRLKVERPEVMDRVTEYMSAVVPGIVDIDKISVGPLETLLFRQRAENSLVLNEFFALSMSDGTLRSLGALVAVNQLADRHRPMMLVGIEEPEAALHPAAAAVLMDALREASSQTQVLMTSHSPDLLDQVDLATDRLLAVVWEGGRTRIAPIDEASREAIRNHLFTPGELLRLDQLEPNRNDLDRQEEQASLTGENRS